MRRWLIALVALVALVALAAGRPAAAQEHPAPMRAGSVVRLAAPGLESARAAWAVASVRHDSLFLVPRADAGRPPVAVALADVTWLSVNRGSQRNALIAGFAGMGIGAAAGAIYGRSRHAPPFLHICILCGEEPEKSPELWAVIGAFAGAPLGALVGRYLIGDHWQRVIPGRGRLDLGSSGTRGLRVAYSIGPS